MTLHPIGFLRTRQQVKFRPATNRRPPQSNELELLPGCGYEDALRDLAGFERIWLLWWFHRNDGWRPLVLPPRGPIQRRGVFATRCTHRPNPLGLTPVPLLGIEGRTLHLGACDLVDGTPIFDIKPYVPSFDAFRSRAPDGLMQLTPRWPPRRNSLLPSTPPPRRRRWLRENWQIDFLPRLTELLSRDPSPHRTRRIRRRGPDRAEIGCGAWLAVFTVADTGLTVLTFKPAYPVTFLLREGYEEIPDRDAQLAFLAQWPAEPGADRAP